MPLPRSINRRDFIDRLRELGFDGPHTGTGPHPAFMVRGEQTVQIPNTHKRKDIGRPLLKRVLNNGGLSTAEFTGGADDEGDAADDE